MRDAVRGAARRRHSLRRLLLGVAAAALVACSVAERSAVQPASVPSGQPPAATPGAAVSPTAAPAAIDEVPDDPSRIDLDYVQRVVDALDARLGELARRVAATRQVDEETTVALFALYHRQQAPDMLVTWRDYFLPRLGEDPGAPVSEVRELLTVRTDCVSAALDRDYRPFGPQVGEFPNPWTFALTPASDRKPEGANPTAWTISEEAVNASQPGRLLPDPCGQPGR